MALLNKAPIAICHAAVVQVKPALFTPKIWSHGAIKPENAEEGAEGDEASQEQEQNEGKAADVLVLECMEVTLSESNPSPHRSVSR